MQYLRFLLRYLFNEYKNFAELINFGIRYLFYNTHIYISRWIANDRDGFAIKNESKKNFFI